MSMCVTFGCVDPLSWHQSDSGPCRRMGCPCLRFTPFVVLLFHKPGENAVPIHPDIDNETWIKWASPVWYDIREMSTLNPGSGSTDADERHICPLQLPLIERAIRLWSNPGELVCSPFAGIGSEGFVALQHRRRFVGIELKPSYWEVACRNLAEAERAASEPTLFEAEPA